MILYVYNYGSVCWDQQRNNYKRNWCQYKLPFGGKKIHKFLSPLTVTWALLSVDFPCDLIWQFWAGLTISKRITLTDCFCKHIKMILVPFHGILWKDLVPSKKYVLELYCCTNILITYIRVPIHCTQFNTKTTNLIQQSPFVTISRSEFTHAFLISFSMFHIS